MRRRQGGGFDRGDDGKGDFVREDAICNLASLYLKILEQSHSRVNDRLTIGNRSNACRHVRVRAEAIVLFSRYYTSTNVPNR